ncbi:LCCL domain-containing protein [uncultured Roseibium sp.]|uniref:LCCL domain-containing protein n=1 Tax=uncultured Roseibium sp. TaxID=1936171 RepID=UPI0026396206|nr:LCCL domain-containing protein [uncultured Roseibium sp.]
MRNNANIMSFAAAVAIAVFANGVSVGGALAAGTTEDFGKVLEHETTLHHFQVDEGKFVGQRFAFTCPASSSGEQTVSVYGSDEYPASTPICLAAQHAGAIGEGGGDLTLQLNPGSAAYTGSVRNGVTTEDFAATDLSIMFLTDATREKLDALQNELVPTLKWKDKFSQTGLANIRLTGQRFAFNCPAAPEKIAGRRVYGTDSYPLNAYVCLSAVHAGQITLSGGPVLVQMDPALEGKFRGSARNGVESKDGPKTVRSISFPAR